jgi:hypothetical protein
MLFLYLGKMPWHDEVNELQGRKRLEYVIRMKQTLEITSYGDNIPGKTSHLTFLNDLKLNYLIESILKSYAHVRRLRFADEPDYEFMKACVMKELISQRMSLAAPFDWQSL